MVTRLALAALAAVLALSTQLQAHALDSPRAYTVRSGDTLFDISQSVGVAVARLVELNQIRDPNRILPGQTLMIEGSAPAAAVAGNNLQPERRYVVKPGDTLSQIASALGVSQSALAGANRLVDPNKLVAGQQLVIPDRLPAPAPDPSDRPAEIPLDANAKEIGGLLDSASRRHGVDPILLKALAWYLSRWRQEAGSPALSQGVMQVTATTQEWVGSTILKRQADRGVAGDNIDIGAAYLAYLARRHGDERLAVAAYIQGPGSVTRDGVAQGTSRAWETIASLRGRFAGPSAGTAISTTSAARLDPAALLQLASQLAGSRARLAVAARNLTTGERFDLKSAEVFPSASVGKIAIMAETFRRIHQGSLTRTTELNADLERMITVSDNDAADRLLDTVGAQHVNDLLAKHGLSATRIHSYFTDQRGTIDGGFNTTSASDATSLLTLIATGRLVNAEASREMRELLLRNSDDSKLVRGVTAGTSVAHKSGYYPGVANDAGIVFAQRGTYVLTVLSEGLSDAESGNQLIATLSRAFFESWR